MKFLDRTYRGPEYRELCEDCVIHQAVAVWTGHRPEHLLKKVQEEQYRRRLEEHRRSFMLYLRGDVFLRVALVRVKAEVAGYLNDNMGILEHKDDKGVKVNILFHADDVKVFKKDVREYGKSAKRTLPVGCLVSVDARRVHVAGLKNVEFQAVVVLAGFWPLTPHPTLLPGGQGSQAPMYELPRGVFTFYYLELAMEARLQRKVNQLKELLNKTKGQIQYDWKDARIIQSKEQFLEWRETMGDTGGRRVGEGRREGRREILDTFKDNSVVEEELKEEEGGVKVVKKTVVERTWYTPEAWEHGGLRIKEEVKEEAGMGREGGQGCKREVGEGGHSAAKRVKREVGEK